MKKLFLIVAVAIFSLGTVNAFAQETTTPATEETAVVEETVVDEVPASDTQLAEAKPMHQVLMQKFLEGGWEWMLPVLLCLVFGLAIAIERMLYLSLSTINSKKLIAQVEEALKKGGIEAAKEVCRNKRGPVASIFYQGLDRYNQGLDSVEKAVVSYGSVQTGRMESGLSWIGLFIALSPMLGFMGTVVGMIEAFDAIQAAGDISPTLVAGGIKVALLTTLLGLIAAVILQLYRFQDRLARKRYGGFVHHPDGYPDGLQEIIRTYKDFIPYYEKNIKHIAGRHPADYGDSDRICNGGRRQQRGDQPEPHLELYPDRSRYCNSTVHGRLGYGQQFQRHQRNAAFDTSDHRHRRGSLPDRPRTYDRNSGRRERRLLPAS